MSETHLMKEPRISFQISFFAATGVEVERAGAQARWPGPNFRFAVNTRGSMSLVFKKLDVGSSLRFPAFIKEKLGLEAG